ncbi:MAG: dihydrolipoamide succinyltransferase [Spirochaetes bacterium RBG_16_49_21]|nr:MAG: dihydrolipoamide succinyltransferase [Spirochaetes bacterium RBG_16_49_21]
MKEEVKIPSVGESIVDGMLMAWLKENGDYVKESEDLYEFETEKASVTVPSPFEGILEIIVPEGTKVVIGQVVATIDTGAAVETAAKEKEPDLRTPKPVSAPEKKAKTEKKAAGEGKKEPETLSPAVRRILEEHDIDLTGVAGTGKDGRITKGDVLAGIEQKPEEKTFEEKKQEERPGAGEMRADETSVKRVAMSYFRKSIARRMLSARQEAAHLTTFNEINMEKLIEMRKAHQEPFQKKYGIKLGFMSFFVKASVEALKEFPVINARIEGDDIVYYNFYDIGVAVSTDRGLLVPVIRNADALTFAGIEKKIADLAQRAKDKKITLPELLGGTFSITNGGIFGSLMSTPIPNHPQPAILGMHAIQERPVAIQGEVKIKPMMYVAVSYDHRLIDGREAVSFLFRIKEHIEDPEEMLLNI